METEKMDHVKIILRAFEQQEWENREILCKALPRKNYQELLGNDVGGTTYRERLDELEWELTPQAAREMWAVNYWVRMEWAWNLLPAVVDHPDEDDPVYLVTIVPDRFAHAVTDDAPGVSSMRRWFQRGLQGFSFIGHIEPAYYVNFTKRASPRPPTVSWHVHVLVWGCGRKILNKRIKYLNEKLKPLFEGVQPADVRRVNSAEIGNTFAYILKAPANEYRVRWTRSGFAQRKSKIRRGNLVRLFRIMRGMKLPDLAVGGGDGTSLLVGAKRAIREDPPRPRSPGRRQKP